MRALVLITFVVAASGAASSAAGADAYWYDLRSPAASDRAAGTFAEELRTQLGRLMPIRSVGVNSLAKVENDPAFVLIDLKTLATFASTQQGQAFLVDHGLEVLNADLWARTFHVFVTDNGRKKLVEYNDAQPLTAGYYWPGADKDRKAKDRVAQLMRTITGGKRTEPTFIDDAVTMGKRLAGNSIDLAIVYADGPSVFLAKFLRASDTVTIDPFDLRLTGRLTANMILVDGEMALVFMPYEGAQYVSPVPRPAHAAAAAPARPELLTTVVTQIANVSPSTPVLLSNVRTTAPNLLPLATIRKAIANAAILALYRDGSRCDSGELAQLYGRYLLNAYVLEAPAAAAQRRLAERSKTAGYLKHLELMEASSASNDDRKAYDDQISVFKTVLASQFRLTDTAPVKLNEWLGLPPSKKAEFSGQGGEPYERARREIDRAFAAAFAARYQEAIAALKSAEENLTQAVSTKGLVACGIQRDLGMFKRIDYEPYFLLGVTAALLETLPGIP